MDLPNELESRAVLAHAFPAPGEADVERARANIQLLRAGRPQHLRSFFPASGARLAAGIALVAAGVGAGYFIGRPAPNTSVPTPLASLLVARGSVPTPVSSSARVLRTREWLEPAFGERSLIADRATHIPPGHDVRISMAHRLPPNGMDMPRFEVDLTMYPARLGTAPGRALDSVTVISAEVIAALPVGAEREPSPGHTRFAGSRWSGSNVLRSGDAIWLYPFGPPRPELAAPVIEIWLDDDTGTVAATPPAYRSLEPLTIETSPRIQGVSLRFEVSDSSGAWRTVKDQTIQRTRSTQNVFIGGPYPRGHLNVTMLAPPFGRENPLCFTWEWGDRQPPRGSFCFREGQATVITPIHGSTGKRLRITLLEKYNTLP